MKRVTPLLSLVFASAASAQSPVTPPDFQMPSGSGCSGDIARYRAVIANDYSSGNVAKSIYAQVNREIDAAEKVCAAGQDAKASSMIHASQGRHGYSTHM
jgi:hypothetical protein